MNKQFFYNNSNYFPYDVEADVEVDEEDVIIDETAAGEEEGHFKKGFQQNNYHVKTTRRHTSNPCEEDHSILFSSTYDQLSSNFVLRTHDEEELQDDLDDVDLTEEEDDDDDESFFFTLFQSEA